ncbi:hypothetical protein B0O80DRAFT_436503, partial [Mortierella sp. GBAus27b]
MWERIHMEKRMFIGKKGEASHCSLIFYTRREGDAGCFTALPAVLDRRVSDISPGSRITPGASSTTRSCM